MVLITVLIIAVLNYHLVVFPFIFNRAIVLKVTSRLTTKALIEGWISGAVLDLILLLLLLSSHLLLLRGLEPLLSEGLVDHVELLVALVLFLKLYLLVFSFFHDHLTDQLQAIKQMNSVTL